MTLKDDLELKNSEAKLAGLEKLIADKRAAKERAPGWEASLRSLERFAGKMRREIAEYRDSVAASRK